MKTLSPSIEQTTTLRQRLSAQQVRFVRLLEMSGPEYEQAVRNELDENPALEVADDTNQDALNRENDTTPDEHEDSFNESSEQLQAADYEDTDDTPTYLLHSASGHNEQDYSYDIQRQWQSPLDILNAQLDTVSAPKRDIEIARYLIGYLDDNGRLTRSLNDIAEDISIAFGVEINRSDLLPALDIIRYNLEPAGLGAVDLRECLLIQLRRIQPKTLEVRVAEAIIQDYFDLFTLKHFDKLQTALGVEKKVVDDALNIIRGLDPKPGRALSDSPSDEAVSISPDFLVYPDPMEEGRFVVSLNERVPELAIEQSFRVDDPNPEARLFIKRRREEAKNFIYLMRRRSETLLAVMRAIVTLQRRFFETDDKSLIRPMILNDVANLTGLDKSVISRATSGKYVATLSGNYPLKLFFNDTPTDDTETSAVKIFAEIQKLIDNEDKTHPLSDRIITEKLNSQGFNLARRTITKYREKNNIPVARLRKEY